MNNMEQHDDALFVKSFHKYLALEKILTSSNWRDLAAKVSVQAMDALYFEFKIQNYTVAIEYELVSLLWYLFHEGKVKESQMKQFYIERIRAFRRNATYEDAEAIFIQETSDQLTRALTPHTTFYVAGIALPGLIVALDQHTVSFDGKSELLDGLAEYRVIRNLVIHNRMTSRRDVAQEILKGEQLAKTLLDKLGTILKDSKKYL